MKRRRIDLLTILLLLEATLTLGFVGYLYYAGDQSVQRPAVSWRTAQR